MTKETDEISGMTSTVINTVTNKQVNELKWKAVRLDPI